MANKDYHFYFKLYRGSLYAAFILGAILVISSAPQKEDYLIQKYCWEKMHPSGDHEEAELSKEDEKLCQGSEWQKKAFQRPMPPSFFKKYMKTVNTALVSLFLFIPALLLRRKYKKLRLQGPASPTE